MKQNNDDDLIELIFYFCYSNCLPPISKIKENKSSFYFNFINEFKNLSNLNVLLNTLFENLTFKQRKI